jgi:hypothetical protein
VNKIFTDILNANIHTFWTYYIKTAHISGALIAATLLVLFLVLIWQHPFTTTYIHLVEATVTLHPQHLATRLTVAWVTRLQAAVYTAFWAWLGAA